MLTFRLATMGDARILHEWRNSAEARAASRNSGEIELGEHYAWLTSALDGTDWVILIAEAGGGAVGTIRVSGTHEVSYYVDAAWRGHGVAREMVGFVLRVCGAPLTASVRHGNARSLRVLEATGFVETARDADFAYWRCGP